MCFGVHLARYYSGLRALWFAKRPADLASLASSRYFPARDACGKTWRQQDAYAQRANRPSARSRSRSSPAFPHLPAPALAATAPGIDRTSYHGYRLLTENGRVAYPQQGEGIEWPVIGLMGDSASSINALKCESKRAAPKYLTPRFRCLRSS